MRGLDCLLSGVAGNIGREKALFNEMLNQWPSLRGISESRAMRRRGAPVSGSMPANQGIKPRRSGVSRAR